MRPTEQETLHFDLGYLPDALYTFRCAGRSAPLQRHTAATLAAARQAQPILRLFPDARISHYVTAVLPSDAIASMTVTTPKTLGGTAYNAPVHVGVHLPAASREAARKRIQPRPRAIHPKLAFHNISAEQFTAVAGDGDLPALPTAINVYQDAVDAATWFLFCHHDLMCLDPNTGSHIVSNEIADALSQTDDDLATQIYQDATHGKPWMVSVQASDGSVYHQPSADVLFYMTNAVQVAVQEVKNDPTLQNIMWFVNAGSTSNSYGATNSASGSEALAVLDVPGSGNVWTARNLTPGNGLSVTFNSYTPPPTTDSWTAAGTWSQNDATPMSSSVVTSLLAGDVQVTITTPNGTVSSATLVPGTQTPGQPVTFAANFSGTGTVSAKFTLNSGQSGLTYSLTASGIGDSAGAQLVDGTQSLCEIPISNVSSMGTISASYQNSWLRHLSLYVQFLEADGVTVITPPSDYPDTMPLYLRTPGDSAPNFEPDPTKKFVALISPVNTVMAVPLPANTTSFTISVPAGTSTVRLLFGGLGRGTYDSAVCPVGIVMTAFAELALPMLLFTGGAAENGNSIISNLISDPEVLFAVCAAGAFLVAGGVATYIALSDDPGTIAESLATKFGPMLLQKGVSSLAKWFAEQEGEAAAEDAIPFVDMGIEALRAATTTAQLIETTVELLDSPYVYETDLTQTMALSVVISCDPNDNEFPPYHALLSVIVAYDCGTTLPASEQPMPDELPNTPITVNFSSIPAGGNLQVFAFFYAANGWQSAQGQSGWLPAQSTANGTLTVSFNVTNNVIPLDCDSIYLHNAKIGMGSTGLAWIDTSTAPTETPQSPPPQSPPSGPAMSITKLVDITIAQRPQMVGYAWEASGLGGSSSDQFTVQTLSIGATPSSCLAFPAAAFSLQSGITFDIASPDDGTGRNFYIDPSPGLYDVNTNPDGGYHLRQVALQDSTAPSMPTGDSLSSWGRFLWGIDRYAVHPQGYVFGITASPDKIHRIDLPAQATTDDLAPMATLLSGSGNREGLISGAAGIAVALDGRIVVAEQGNLRLQAFDINGNPVEYFAGGTSSTTPLQNSPGDTILDLAIEAKGYIYVLYYTGQGATASEFFLDIYTPDGTFLVQTPSMAAACISVDLLRSIFTLNYETIIDQNNRVQPSISRWLPPPPPAKPPDCAGSTK